MSMSWLDVKYMAVLGISSLVVAGIGAWNGWCELQCLGSVGAGFSVGALAKYMSLD